MQTTDSRKTDYRKNERKKNTEKYTHLSTEQMKNWLQYDHEIGNQKEKEEEKSQATNRVLCAMRARMKCVNNAVV